MSYLVLARKWRPQTFADLVGQDHVSRTLANAIASGRVAHAYLFTGVRGVGKTTSARIMAKALNCQQGPTASPCLECAACREVANGSDVDVQEIDGASYNGVDEVRRLQETLPYRPARDRHKIFIVDEVHMLSQNAWNAFLKTLEEPPPHVKFIFATTEVHKVPITILSRCQRYDFKLIPSQLIASRLRYVLEQEHIGADDEAVSIVAREAGGSLRDAMSLLDQAIAWSGDRLVGEEVSRVLGVAGRAVLGRIAKAIVQGDGAECLTRIGDLADQGLDVPHVSRDLLSYLRDLVVAKVCKDPRALLDCTEEETVELLNIARDAELDDLVRLQHGLSQAFDEVARSGQPRVALEMALVRLAHRPALQPLDELLDRLTELEQKLGPGSGPPPHSPAPRSPQGRSAPSTPSSPSSSSASSPGAPARSGQPAPSRSSSSGGPSATAPQPVQAVAPGASLAIAAPAAPLAVVTAASSLAIAPSSLATAIAPSSSARAVAPSSPAIAIATGSSGVAVAPSAVSKLSATAVAAPAAAVASPAPTSLAVPSVTGPFAVPFPAHAAPRAPGQPVMAAAAKPLPSAGAGAATVEHSLGLVPSAREVAAGPVDLSTWREILGRVRAVRPALAAVLEHASPIVCSKERLVLGYEPGSFFAEQATEGVAVDVLTRTVRAYFGAPTQIAFDLSATPKGANTIAAIDQEERREKLENARRTVAEHPLVRAAVEVLGAEIREIRLPE